VIAVVIPYFQREPGVLRRALASISAQHSCPLPIHVIVVDDASPAPAAPEVAAAGNFPGTVRVITQPNAGPGAARNTGLDHTPTGTRYIAFLDSDDEWSSDHLARAVQALQAGFDLYFADHLQLGQTSGAFARAGRISPADHPRLAVDAEALYAYRGDLMDQIIRGNVIGTSTVVYDYTRFPKSRFRAEFTNAGEDYLFWMSLASQGARSAFSSRIAATYGKGVNVYSSAGWGSDEHLLRVHNELKFKKTIGRLFPITPSQQAHISEGIDALRDAFARDLIRRLRRLQRTSISLLGRHLLLDPVSYLRLPVLAVSLVLARRRR
jgi:succinoglycan biosynthesis protein ExoW